MKSLLLSTTKTFRSKPFEPRRPSAGPSSDSAWATKRPAGIGSAGNYEPPRQGPLPSADARHPGGNRAAGERVVEHGDAMGLDTSHDCWHGAYSAFHRWRCKLAEVAGLPPLEFMEGFWADPGGTRPSGVALTLRVAASDLKRAYPESDIAESLLRRFEGFPIRWACLKPDPLYVLLYHSDCDGSISAADCGPIADRLAQLLPLLPSDPDHGHIGDWRAKTQAFIDGLRAAAAAGEDVMFH